MARRTAARRCSPWLGSPPRRPLRAPVRLRLTYARRAPDRRTVAHRTLKTEGHRRTDVKGQGGVNLMGVVHGIKSFVPRMLEQKDECHVVNTASVAGLISVPASAVYCVTKHSVVTLSECLHHDLQLFKAKVGVSVLCPAFVNTG